jgi:hypothetical protein
MQRLTDGCIKVPSLFEDIFMDKSLDFKLLHGQCIMFKPLESDWHK